MDFVDEILVGLSDEVVASMFRKSPGAATLFFAVAMSSLGSVMAPKLAAHLLTKKASQFLESIPAYLSKHATGVPIKDGMFDKLVGVFLEWKAGFFATESIISTCRGDFEFLKGIFNNPEQILVGAAVLITGGWAHLFGAID